MPIYEILCTAGFKPLRSGPVIPSELSNVIERAEAGKNTVAAIPGYFVPEARPEDYDHQTFQDNYVVFLRPKSD